MLWAKLIPVSNATQSSKQSDSSESVVKVGCRLRPVRLGSRLDVNTAPSVVTEAFNRKQSVVGEEVTL